MASIIWRGGKTERVRCKGGEPGCTTNSAVLRQLQVLAGVGWGGMRNRQPTSASTECIKRSYSSESPIAFWFLSVFLFFRITREVNVCLHNQCFQIHLQSQTQQINSSAEKEQTSCSVRNVSLIWIILASFPETHKYSIYCNYSKQK